MGNRREGFASLKSMPGGILYRSKLYENHGNTGVLAAVNYNIVSPL